MTIRTLLIAVLAATISIAALPLAASAQPAGGPGDDLGPPPAGPPNFTKEQRTRFRKKMRRRFAELLRGKMKLPEVRAKQVERIVRDGMKRKRPLHQVMRATHKTLRRLLTNDSNDQRAYADALRTMKQTRKALKMIHQAQTGALRQLLTPKQRAQLLDAHHRMRRHMRQRRQRQRRQRQRQRSGKGGRRGDRGGGR